MVKTGERVGLQSGRVNAIKPNFHVFCHVGDSKRHIAGSLCGFFFLIYDEGSDAALFNIQHVFVSGLFPTIRSQNTLEHESSRKP